MNKLSEKARLATVAEQHIKRMDEDYPSEIKESVNKSHIYGDPDLVPEEIITDKTPVIKFEGVTSEAAIFNNAEEGKKMAVLNFASYKNPGGMFLNGSSAQEEMLCHSSCLFNVLRMFPDYYDWNRKHLNKSLYRDRAIYSPDVVFVKYRESVKCDVITCAAPNKGAAIRYKRASVEENYKTLEERIRFIKNIAETEGVDILILGAFGTGVFRQKVDDVVENFKRTFKNTTISKIIYAVPGRDMTSRIFKSSFS